MILGTLAPLSFFDFEWTQIDLSAISPGLYASEAASFCPLNLNAHRSTFSTYIRVCGLPHSATRVMEHHPSFAHSPAPPSSPHVHVAADAWLSLLVTGLAHPSAHGCWCHLFSKYLRSPVQLDILGSALSQAAIMVLGATNISCFCGFGAQVTAAIQHSETQPSHRTPWWTGTGTCMQSTARTS